MTELSEEHDVDDALLRRQSEGTAAIVLEFDVPEADS